MRPRLEGPTELHLYAVGRLKDGPEATLFARYAARLRPALAVTEIAEPATSRRGQHRPGAALHAALPPRAFVVALDRSGSIWSSEQLASRLGQWQGQQQPLCFAIGGADGLEAATLARADALLSFGPMTWPHLLARVMLAEQLYRAQSITSAHPYHLGHSAR